MDRRRFIRTGFAAAMVARLGIGGASAAGNESAPADGVRRGFDGPVSSESGTAGPEDLRMRFLGTGASGWKGPDCGRRRHSSVLLDGKVLIDLTFSAVDLIPEGCRPVAVFYTHSHGDHFDPETALKVGVARAYVNESWVSDARKRFKKASGKTGIRPPEVIPVKLGQKVTEGGLVFTQMPANHPTHYPHEQAVIYLVEKGTTEDRLGVRLFYATDTGGILGAAASIAGIDPLSKKGRAVTAFVMEGTIPPNQEEDYRIFNHSTIETVGRTVNTLIQYGRYLPPKGQPAYITHMSTKNFPPHDELNRWVPWPLRAPYDGLDVIFRPSGE